VSIEALRAELRERLKTMPAEAKAELKQEVRKATGKWFPTPGPQTEALESQADVLLYGGQGGGGKTDLICGLSITQHRRSLVMRRHYVDLGAICERAIEVNGTRKGFSGSIPPKLRTEDGRLMEFGAAANLGDEQHWQGQPHDLLCLDEVVQFLEQQVRFLMGWVRSTTEGQRKRVVMCSNPPVGTQGDWVITMFAPWLDPRFPNPAKPGELRWVVTDTETGKDRWVDGPDVKIEDGQGGYLIPQSRTFIPARLSDNPYLRDTGYKAQLDALPEPLRSAVRDGNFMASRVDEADQVIPTAWIRAAQARWKPTPPTGIPQCAIGVDGARVHDDTVLAPRYDGWFDKLIVVPGKSTPHGTDLAALVIKHRRDGSKPVIDVNESVGAQAYAHLKDQEIECHAYRGLDESVRRTAEKQLGFYNKRSEAIWKFREALDPGQDGGSPIALPDDPELVSDLTAVTWELVPRGIKALSKEKVVEKLGRSPNRGDAVIMSWFDGAKAPSHMQIWMPDERVAGGGIRARHHRPAVNLGSRRGGSSPARRR
jgi:hypothetical protein